MITRLNNLNLTNKTNRDTNIPVSKAAQTMYKTKLIISKLFVSIPTKDKDEIAPDISNSKNKKLIPMILSFLFLNSKYGGIKPIAKTIVAIIPYNKNGPSHYDLNTDFLMV